MSAQSPTNILAHYTIAVRNAAPKEWEAFCQCFDAYATSVTVAVTSSPADGILVAQGQARAFLHLLKVFTDPTTHIKSPNTQQP